MAEKSAAKFATLFWGGRKTEDKKSIKLSTKGENTTKMIKIPVL